MTPENVAYLAALVAQSEEVRSRCHLKFGRNLAKSVSADTFPVDLHLNHSLTATTTNCTNPHSSVLTSTTGPPHAHSSTPFIQHQQLSSQPGFPHSQISSKADDAPKMGGHPGSGGVSLPLGASPVVSVVATLGGGSFSSGIGSLVRTGKGFYQSVERLKKRFGEHFRGKMKIL